MPATAPRDSTLAVVGDGFGSLIVYSTAGRPLPYQAVAEPVGAEERTGPPLALLVGAAVVVLAILAVVLLAG